ncbi:UDP-3-O-[3-hydroxymyristoyl] glucosamine N-acyltransferase, partial [Litoreibacter janthinus]
MFTSRRTSLSNFADSAGLQVLRDAEIAFVGKIPTDLEARVVPAAKPEHLEYAKGFEGIAAFVVPPDLAELVPAQFGLATADAPQAAVALIQDSLSAIEDFQWEGFASRIDPTAVIEPGAYVAARDVVIGAQTYIGPNAVILPRSIIGAYCYIGAGTVVGMEAFDQATGAPKRRLLKQSGGVRIEDHVTIQANCTISRATFGGFCTIGTGSLVDALVYIAHDCSIGRDVTICSNVSISGRVRIGDKAYLGPQCAISNGVS